MMPVDFYAQLGVPASATAQEIKTAYRRLARTHHPDRGGDEAKFRRLTEAYETLGDARRRREYDARHRTQCVTDLLGIPEAERAMSLLFGGQRPIDPSPGRPHTMRVAVPESIWTHGGVVDIVLPQGTRHEGRTISVTVPADIARSPVLVLPAHGGVGETKGNPPVQGEAGALYLVLFPAVSGR